MNDNTDYNFQKKMYYEVLATVKDPEIDSVSIIDLEWLKKLRSKTKHVNVDISANFVGCPALEIIRNNIVNAVNELRRCGGDNV